MGRFDDRGEGIRWCFCAIIVWDLIILISPLPGELLSQKVLGEESTLGLIGIAILNLVAIGSYILVIIMEKKEKKTEKTKAQGAKEKENERA